MLGPVYRAMPARTAGCRPFLGNRLARAGESAYHPDVLVVCGPARGRLDEADASLGLYLLVDPLQRRLEVAQVRAGRATWQVFGSGGVVPTRYGTLVVDDLYDALDASATTR